MDEASDEEMFLSKVHHTMDELRQNGSALVSIPCIEMSYGLLPFRSAKRKFEEGYEEMVKRRSLPPLFSEMGVLEEGRMRFGDIVPSDCYLTAPLAYPPLLIIGLSAYQGRFTLSIGFCAYGIDRGQIEKLFDLVDSKLPP
jgi:NRPS condensation-like uncharacterized protein